LQDALEAALARSHSTVPTPVKLLNFARSPMRMALLQTHHLADHLLTQLRRMTMRTPAFLGQPCPAIPQQPITPFITSLGADSIFAAKLTKVLCPQRSHRKLNSLIHFFGLFPRHPKKFPN